MTRLFFASKSFLTPKARRGFSLLEMTIVLGLLGLVMAGVSGIMVNMMRGMAQVTAKQNLIQAENLLTNALQNPTSCDYQFAGQTLDLTGAPDAATGILPHADLALANLRAGDAASPIFAQAGQPLGGEVGAPIVNEVRFKNLRAVSAAAGEYRGDVVISLVQQEGQMAFKPVTIPLSVLVDTAGGTPPARPIVRCALGQGMSGILVDTMTWSPPCSDSSQAFDITDFNYNFFEVQSYCKAKGNNAHSLFDLQLLDAGGNVVIQSNICRIRGVDSGDTNGAGGNVFYPRFAGVTRLNFIHNMASSSNCGGTITVRFFR